MAEHHLWHTLHKYTKMVGHFERIENMVGAGMPDVTYCIRSVEGFIELKQLKEWPTRPDTVVALPHYTPQQRIWSRRRLAAGGRVYVLLEVVRPVPTYLLFSAAWARVALGITATQEDCRRNALVLGEGRFPIGPLITQLIHQEGVFSSRDPFTFPRY